jgi:hypothetical protein
MAGLFIGLLPGKAGFSWLRGLWGFPMAEEKTVNKSSPNNTKQRADIVTYKTA